LEEMGTAESAIRTAVSTQLSEVNSRILAGENLSESDRQTLVKTMKQALRLEEFN